MENDTVVKRIKIKEKMITKRTKKKIQKRE